MKIKNLLTVMTGLALFCLAGCASPQKEAVAKEYAPIEVAVPGKVIETLSNPYGIATVFALNAEETKNIVPVARALIGNR